ncbi:isocitrate lyase/phosphoenolpyruvate mutase family protein [Amycolatopsis sp. OK19-0408]|uniref:Isocitrate lyase/phosphoenolpyruvate mutase family protein n=1 Tax=Amycolatopsis iheyensis TaxID=2945988 RepID=A0A9X2SK16_9PSEU|nr:isocitrate lyase/phosphoenolpyruvate mutase family protein [Amycolatopsis iheyensis]MCR6482920.1 isocitrate lyase/phosphoenolpyruvate mutase family protein [Amycolatopsis iheyensis]
MSEARQRKADELQHLNQDGIYVLPNAWDTGSAVLSANAGAKVIATTSAGVSWAGGRPDGQHLTRERAVAVVRDIAAAVDVPVSADIEGGYGPDPADVAETVRAVVEVGAVGVNLEDSGAPAGGLFDDDAQAARIKAARDAATAAGLPNLAINARTDVYLAGIGAPEGRYAETLRRARAYAAAGADTIFVPGLTDLDVITKFVGESPVPVNIMAGPGAPSIAELAEAGVRRVSLGASVAFAAYSLVVRATREVLEKGTYTELGATEPWDVINGGFTGAR